MELIYIDIYDYFGLGDSDPSYGYEAPRVYFVLQDRLRKSDFLDIIGADDGIFSLLNRLFLSDTVKLQISIPLQESIVLNEPSSLSTSFSMNDFIGFDDSVNSSSSREIWFLDVFYFEEYVEPVCYYNLRTTSKLSKLVDFVFGLGEFDLVSYFFIKCYLNPTCLVLNEDNFSISDSVFFIDSFLDNFVLSDTSFLSFVLSNLFSFSENFVIFVTKPVYDVTTFRLSDTLSAFFREDINDYNSNLFSEAITLSFLYAKSLSENFPISDRLSANLIYFLSLISGIGAFRDVSILTLFANFSSFLNLAETLTTDTKSSILEPFSMPSYSEQVFIFFNISLRDIVDLFENLTGSALNRESLESFLAFLDNVAFYGKVFNTLFFMLSKTLSGSVPFLYSFGSSSIQVSGVAEDLLTAGDGIYIISEDRTKGDVIFDLAGLDSSRLKRLDKAFADVNLTSSVVEADGRRFSYTGEKWLSFGKGLMAKDIKVLLSDLDKLEFATFRLEVLRRAK